MRIPNFAIASVIAVLSSACGTMQAGRFTPQPGQFEAIDRHVAAAPRSVGRSFKKLGDYLGSAAKTDLEKARAIYRWITTNIEYDTAQFFSGNITDAASAPTEVLYTRKAVCGGYANLFHQLAWQMGLSAATVTGIGKGYGYASSDTEDKRRQINHAWNAVKIDGAWFLVDATWGSGGLDEKNGFERRLNEEYFLADPEFFVTNHLPNFSEWQLRPIPATPEEFHSSNRFGALYYRLGLSIDVGTMKNNRMEAGGELSIAMKAPTPPPVMLNVSVGTAPISWDWSIVDWGEGGPNLQVRFPNPGEYVVAVGAKDPEGDGEGYSPLVHIVVSATQAARSPFPVQYKGWSTRRYLLEAPRDGRLRRGRPYDFVIFAPRSAGLFIANGPKRVELKRDGDRFRARFTPSSADLQIIEGNPYAAGVGMLGYTVIP